MQCITPWDEMRFSFRQFTALSADVLATLARVKALDSFLHFVLQRWKFVSLTETSFH